MKSQDLAADLRALDVKCAVEAQGKLAVIIPTEPTRLDAKTRRAIVARGRAHGFTNVCLELTSVNATVSGS